MTCRDCGRVSEGRLCRECERDRRWEDRFDEAFGADDEDDDAGAAPVATDGGSKYVVQTGDGYVGTFVVGHHSCAVNMATAGYERGTDLVVVANGDRVATITPPPADSEAVLQKGFVNDDGYFAITAPVQDHLGVENGDDVRLYETETEHAIVDADDDPFAATDGGQVTLDERLLAIDDGEAVEIAYDTPQATTTQTVRGIVQKSGRDGGVKLIPPGTAYLLADEVGGDRSYRVWATGEVESITDPRQLHDDDHRNPSRIGEFVDIREVFGDGGVRPPKIYQVVELPESEKGMPCPRWMGDPPKPCDNRAEYVFVFEATLDEDSDDRKNCLCCGECRPQPGVWTDGGEAIDYEGAGFVVASVYRLDSMRELADDPATPSGIAEATGNDIPQISRALGNLREKGLVELLVAEETHKGRIYGLTERGESVLSAANQVVRHDAGGDGP